MRWYDWIVIGVLIFFLFVMWLDAAEDMEILWPNNSDDDGEDPEA